MYGRQVISCKSFHRHPSLLPFAFTTSYLILEYIEGGELFEYIVQKGRLDLNEALRYFQQIIHAVHYCHCFNIAHRDLKPENILLDKNKNVKVADFGMAIWESAAGMLETSCGSPHYASPEILNGKRYSGASADVWSCGVILYALITGTLPFHDEAIEVLLRKVRAGQFDMPKDIPKEAQDLISRMLQKDVAKRITIPEILRHPFFCMLPTSEPSERKNAILLMENLIEPIPQVEQVDAEIFANLRTLWPTLSDKVLLDKLQSEK
jgi:serine/threonine-protein kinase HSL1 (negative regulator of Swe1 kinase)